MLVKTYKSRSWLTKNTKMIEKKKWRTMAPQRWLRNTLRDVVTNTLVMSGKFLQGGHGLRRPI